MLRKIVPPDGPKVCKMALIGEAPGADEEMEGKPFVLSLIHI